MNSYDEITPGLWYLSTSYGHGWTVVEVMKDQLDLGLGELIVYSIGEDRPYELEAYALEDFICLMQDPDRSRR